MSFSKTPRFSPDFISVPQIHRLCIPKVLMSTCVSTFSSSPLTVTTVTVKVLAVPKPSINKNPSAYRHKYLMNDTFIKNFTTKPGFLATIFG